MGTQVIQERAWEKIRLLGHFRVLFEPVKPVLPENRLRNRFKSEFIQEIHKAREASSFSNSLWMRVVLFVGVKTWCENCCRWLGRTSQEASTNWKSLKTPPAHHRRRASMRALLLVCPSRLLSTVCLPQHCSADSATWRRHYGWISKLETQERWT